MALRRFAAARERVYSRSCDEFALDLNRGEPLIEETYRMSMQSHLAELENDIRRSKTKLTNV